MAESMLLATAKRKSVADRPDNAPDSGLLQGQAIAASASRVVLFNPLLGIVSRSEAHPLWAAPLQSMFTLSCAEEAFAESEGGIDRSH